MATTETGLIVRTFEVMEAGDCLMLTGGTFPGQNEEGVVEIDVHTSTRL